MSRFCIFIMLISVTCFELKSQEVSDSTLNKIAGRIFLPSFDVGFQFSGSDLIGNSLVAKTSIEYRFRNNDDFFLRLSLDTYAADYFLKEVNQTSNNIEGTVQFSDFLLAPGYRLGDQDVRFIISTMAGVKTYSFPTASLQNQTILVRQKSKSIFTSTFLIAGELYFDQKSAITVSAHYNLVWKEIDFWEDNGGAFGISLGFITSLL